MIIQLDKLSEPEFDLDSWKSPTSIVLARIFGDDCQGIKSIDKIKLFPRGRYIGSGDNRDSCKKQRREILNTYISQWKTFGLPSKKDSSSGISISLTQNQTL